MDHWCPIRVAGEATECIEYNLGGPIEIEFSVRVQNSHPITRGDSAHPIGGNRMIAIEGVGEIRRWNYILVQQVAEPLQAAFQERRHGFGIQAGGGEEPF